MGGLEGVIVQISRVMDWVAKVWKGRDVELLELGGPCVGFIFFCQGNWLNKHVQKDGL